MSPLARRILESRRLLHAGAAPTPTRKREEEGGCGVVGFASSVPVSGKHIFEPSVQMHNRGNGKGGGIAAASLDASQLGVDEATLRDTYILQVAYLDPGSRAGVEAECIEPVLDVLHGQPIATVDDHRDVGLDVRPPDVVRYFVRGRSDALARFRSENHLEGAPDRAVEDELVYQNSVRLNGRFYASLGDQQAFVLSHARNLVIFKIVGYAEQVVQFYRLEDFRARIWIAHQRYPTKGRVWHPAGSHPFIGMNEALVHNGDFANYHGVSEYLGQLGVAPQFLTDTEVSALLFDQLTRVFGYPLEYAIEAMAPTTELDFDRLPEDRRRIYSAIQSLHVQGSPDGPWFFIIARSEPDTATYRLLGITDTSMLRPQVFAIQEGDVSIGLVASEKQAIDATLSSLSAEDPRFRKVADRYWNARGGSYTDGGAFIFTTTTDGERWSVSCADKFGRVIEAPPGEYAIDRSSIPGAPRPPVDPVPAESGPAGAFERIVGAMPGWRLSNVRWIVDTLVESTSGGAAPDDAVDLLALLVDRMYDTGGMKRSAVREILEDGIDRILGALPGLDETSPCPWRRIDRDSRGSLRPPRDGERVLVVDASRFDPEGDDCDARLEVDAHGMGWKRFVIHRLRGQRFTGCGFGPGTSDVTIDVFGSSGDYLASGIDGMRITVHGNGQDQLAQIMKDGELVVHGDVGQAFLYGGKGGEVYIRGNGAGRPLINAVGRPRVVINGTCLDYLAEAFMAGDPHAGGGFVVLNGLAFDDRGRVVEQPTPYPGSNLFSLASGGAIFVRDPHRELVDEQLNGGEFAELTDADWDLVRPYLEKNQRLFGIRIDEHLLTVDGVLRPPREVYRKVRAVRLAVLAKVQVPE